MSKHGVGQGLRVAAAGLLVLGAAFSFQVLPPGFRGATPPPPQGQPAQPPPNQPQPNARPGQSPSPTTQPAAPAVPKPDTSTLTIAPPSTTGGMNLQNASLVEVIDLLARQLKINYILDPRVKGGITINTYGDTSKMDNRTLLDTILRINGAVMVQVGDIYRIIPLAEAQSLPIHPEVNVKPTSEDDRIMLDLVFLKYATVDELAKLLNEFRGEHAKIWTYPSANLLVIQDSRRNVKRLMELVALFDTDSFAGERVKLFEVKHSRPTDIAKELENIFKGMSLTSNTTPVKFLPVDRINTVIAVAPNPGVFGEVENWITKLDVSVKSTAGSIDNYIYRVKYGSAPMLAMAIMQLYGGAGYGMMGGMYGGGGMGGMYGGGMGGMGGMYGGGMGGMYGGGGGMGGMYGGMGGMGGMGGGGGGMYVGGGAGVGAQAGYSTASGGMAVPGGVPAGGVAGGSVALPPGMPAASPDLTGMYLANAAGGNPNIRIPRVIPNPMDNTLLIQGTPTEYQSIVKLLNDLDIPPRQVLIEARIYEVDLTGSLQSGVTAYLQNKGGNTSGLKLDTHKIVGGLSGGGMGLTAGAFIGGRELLAALSTQEIATKARVLSAPSLIATDSIPASLNVGIEVPTLTAQAVTGAQSGGSSLFANSIANRNTGVTLNITARVNPTGIVTMVINQEVSAPIYPAASAGIQSPSFSKRTVQTQVTLQDGDTVAIGGIIQEGHGMSTTGIPGLNRIPVLGAAFGNRSYSRDRTELIIFLTPKVIFDTNDLLEASDELKNRLKTAAKYTKKEN
ncbi:MAG TPA: type II secretion system secretin GspD [Bryobacteraceae bacterium]|nr:type II secretion system secretin GspD [Bryobacteraceae bacterium]